MVDFEMCKLAKLWEIRV